MKHNFGLNDFQLRQKGIKESVVMDTSALVNGHALIAGMSGSGKSYQLQGMLRSGAAQNVEFDIIDVHNELDVDGTAAVIYSTATRFGYNPLVLNTDRHSGGVTAKINEFIASVNAATSTLGQIQEGTLRQLLEDLYRFNGIREDDASTWKRTEITESERARLLSAKQHDKLRTCYPTLEDLIEYTRRKRDSQFLGGSTQVMRALEACNKAARTLRLKHRAAKRGEGDSNSMILEALVENLNIAKDDAVLAFSAYVQNVESGHELQEYLKYPNADVLSSLYTRLTTINASGTLRSNPPPFGESKVRCHQIKYLADPEQRMFVYRRLTDIFRQSRDSGIKPDVSHVIVLDEAAKFFSRDSDNIINVIAKEGRKFGLALWCCSQSPTSFPEEFVVNVGTTLLLGLSDAEKDRVARMWKVDTKALDYVASRKVACVKLLRYGESSSKFQNVIVSNAYAEKIIQDKDKGKGGGNVTEIKGSGKARQWASS